MKNFRHTSTPNLPAFSQIFKFSSELQLGALKSETGRSLLQSHAHLEEEVFDQLLGSYETQAVPEFIRVNLTYSRALRAIKHPSFLSHFSDPSQYPLNETLAVLGGVIAGRKTLSKRTIKILSEANQAILSNILLNFPEVPLELKKREAMKAYQAYRPSWLSSLEASPLSDDEVWEVLTAPDTVPECFEGTMLHNSMVELGVTDTAYLLFKRPALRSRAVKAEDAMILTAVSVLELSVQDQLVFIETLLNIAKFKKAAFASAFSQAMNSRESYYSHDKSPVESLVRAPWCSKIALEAVVENVEFFGIQSIQQAQYSTGFRVVADAESSWSKRYLRKDLDVSNTPMADMSAQDWCKFFAHLDGSTLFRSFVALQGYSIKGMTPKAVDNRRCHLSNSSRLLNLRKRDGHRTPRYWGEKQYEGYGAFFFDLPAKRPPISFPEDSYTGHEPANQVRSDPRILEPLMTLGLSAQDWETFFALSANFEGTSLELVETVKALR